MGLKLQIALRALVATLALALVLSGCSALKSALQNPNYVYENGAVLVGGNDKPIELKNNPQAKDVSYQTVLNFIREDPTDSFPYVAKGSGPGVTPFVCSDFAERVHNNAETAGLRVGYVGIDFADGSVGHAIDAFQTTDEGLVYVDCTGPSLFSQLEDDGAAAPNESWDKIGYLEIGQKYGVIALDRAASAKYD
jgi:hypothetical protein